MRRDEIPDELRCLAFDFFYWFSRFEFALKEARFLKSEKPGDTAEVNWERFYEKFSNDYKLTANAQALIHENPQRQIVDKDGFDFGDASFGPDPTDLKRVMVLVKTVRNNLFHGGKHGSKYWDNPERMRRLLSITIKVLHDLADETRLQSDYRQRY